VGWAVGSSESEVVAVDALGDGVGGVAALVRNLINTRKPKRSSRSKKTEGSP